MFDISRKVLWVTKRFLRLLFIIPVGLLIRGFGYKVLQINASRIGHLTTETDCLIKEIRLGRKKQGKFLLLLDRTSVANRAYIELLPGFIRPVFLSNQFLRVMRLLTSSRIALEDTSHYTVSMYKTAEIYRINSMWESKPPVMVLPTEWREKRRKIFQKMGIPDAMPYVCIHAREGGYSPLDETWHSGRNVDIDSFKPTVRALRDKGLAVIRMGDSTMKPLREWGPFVFDYAKSSDRAPWLDLSISSDCFFFIGGSSGASYMASVFGRPVASVGMSLPFNFSNSGLSFDIGIPKLFRRKATKTFVSFPSILSWGLSEWRLAEEIERSEYELVESSPDEITEVVEEMLQRLTNTWLDAPDDAALQKKLHALLRPGNYSYGTSSRCGALFLRRYRHLLEDENGLAI